ncbi:MAG: PHP domain protein [Candidatus Magasanikbacteria bacterium GW2011_GWA2_37_8]|uniref:PHP domain protein n=1 Tax=Candidatus Magasanikbacteria bacterium GW2011_GWA2_37_8 TaxID=1619036 RepID=A0A0G0KJP4_9BACT|nr:MAG: PHP domain protein [Candidatus Magasanikbacteria bacterium GW2011_GWA2_37_8]
MIIVDLHIHSRFSRACSPELNLPNIAEWCGIKGINLVATGDFTHPAWFEEIKDNLIEEGNGLLHLKNGNSEIKFILGTEVSCIYSQGGKTRRVHLCLFFPNLADVEKFNNTLTDRGCNIHSDGRPILGLSSIEVLKIMKSINERSVMIPAHAWTPWFAVFGSKSGFDSLEECFGDLSSEIFAIETGLSSDPAMNWMLSALDKVTLVSSSDAHSLPNLGREANVFNLDIAKASYDDLFLAIKNKDPKIFLNTVEFYPEEGMYHFDGHRDCDVCFAPADTKKNKNICPKCKKPVVVGVLNRVEVLADRAEGFVPSNSIPFVSLVGLDKIICEALGIKSRSSNKVQKKYNELIKKGDNEFNILLNLSYPELAKITLPEIVEGIRRVREKKLSISPGFDGQYGKVTIFSSEERKVFQEKLF